MHNQLNISRIFKCDAKTLFNAIGEGMLLKSTGAIAEKTKIDFQVGGKYQASWESCEDTFGEFLEIQPFSKIVFTWNKTPKSQKRFQSTVTINLIEQEEITTLFLKHEGLPNEHELTAHDSGWEHSMKDMYQELIQVFAQKEKNNTGLDINFSLQEIIQAPLEKVFEYVKNSHHLQQYFQVKMSRSFEKGTSFTWDFENHPTFELHTHEVINNSLIKFKWGEAHIVFTFSSRKENHTTVRIHATGYQANQKSLKDAFLECNGWTDFLFCLKNYSER